jgi:cellulose biosynthesis protein BcsQ
MLRQLQDFIVREGWSDLTLLPFFSMVDRRRALHQELIARARAEFPHMLATEVPDWSEIERMSVRRAPLAACAPKSEAARIFVQLWREIRVRSGAPEPLAPTAAAHAPANEETQPRPEAG